MQLSSPWCNLSNSTETANYESLVIPSSYRSEDIISKPPNTRQKSVDLLSWPKGCMHVVVEVSDAAIQTGDGRIVA